MAQTLLAYYCFNDNDTATVRDFSLHGRNSAGSSLSISTDAEAIGKVGVFDGINTNLQVTDFSETDGLSVFSIVAKIKLSAIGVSHYISYRISHHLLEITTANKVKITLTGSPNGTLTDTTTLSANTWYTIIMTYDGANIYLYVNNINAVSSQAYTQSLNSNSNDLYIGYNGVDAGLNGKMEMISYYNKAFLAEEIETVMEYASGLKYEIADAKIQTGDLILTSSGIKEICVWSEEFDERLFNDGEDHQFNDGTASMF